MYWLCPSHAPSAAVAGRIVYGWWDHEALLCVAYHSQLTFYALVGAAPFSRVAEVPLRARILAVEVSHGQQEVLYVLTDHPHPRLVAFRPGDAHGVRTARVWLLDQPFRPASDVGVTLALEKAHGRSSGRWVLTHTHTGYVHLAKLGTDIAFHARLAHATLVSATLLERTSTHAPAMLACLSISSSPHTKDTPVLTFHTIHTSRRTLEHVPWATMSSKPHDRKVPRLDVPGTWHVPIRDRDAMNAHYVLAMPAEAGGGVLLFCSDAIYLVPRPRDVRQSPPSTSALHRVDLDRPVYVVSATCLPMRHDRVRVVFGTEDGRVSLLHVVRRASWEQVDLDVKHLGMAPVATAPQGLSSLAEDYVFLASNTGDSLVWHVQDGVKEVHRWPSLAPIIDFVKDDASFADRIITASGAGSTASIRAVTRRARTRCLLSKPMALLDVHALDHHTTLLVHPSHSAIVRDARIIDTLHEQIVHASRNLVVTETGMYTYNPKRTLWEAPAPVLACTGNDHLVVVGLATLALMVLSPLDDGQWTVVHTLHTHAPVSSLDIADVLVASFWDRSLCMYAVPDMKLLAHHTTSSLVCSALWHRFVPDGPAYVVLGCNDGHVLVHDAHYTRIHSRRMGTHPVRLARVPLSALGSSMTGVVAFGRHAYFLYLKESVLCGTAWSVDHVTGLTCTASTPTLELACATKYGLEVHAIDALDQIDVQTKALPQPATTLQSMDSHIVVTTCPAESESGTLRVLAQDTLEDVCVLPLYARPTCACIAELQDALYVVVGLAAGATDGKIAAYLWSDGMLHAAWSKHVDDHVCALTTVSGYLAAAIGHEVHTYAMEPNALTFRRPWDCAFVSSCLASKGSTLVVGDAMHSLTVLTVAEDGSLSESARDLHPYWTSAVCVLDTEQQQYLGTDVAMNLFVAERAKSTEPESPWSHVMRHAAACHFGDLVNAMHTLPGGGVMYATASGALGTLVRVPEPMACVLLCLQDAMIEAIPAPGDIPWESWRTSRTDTRTEPPHHILDADVLRIFVSDPSVRPPCLEKARSLAQARDIPLAEMAEERMLHMLHALLS